MPLRLDTRSPDFAASFNALLAMKREVAEDVDQAVQAIIADVVAHGDAALIGYSRKFDRVDLEKLGLRVGGADIDAAFEHCPPEALDALRFAHARIIAFHERQLPQDHDLPIRSASNSAGAGFPSRRSGSMFRAAPRAIRLRF